MALPFKITLRDQYQQLAKKAEEQSLMIQSAEKFIEEICTGRIDAELGNSFTDSGLFAALTNMRAKLQELDTQEKERSWRAEGLSALEDILRQHDQDLTKLGDKIVSALVKYLGASQGGLFVLVEQEHSAPVLKLMSCYAYERKKHLHKEIGIGEGLVGQVYLEKGPLQLNKIPEGYLELSSGLGKDTPKQLLVAPAIHNDQVQGVVELAFFKPIEDKAIDFVLQFGKSLAATLQTILTNQKTTALLEASQEQTEEMRAQEEEMRQNFEELQATQEEIHRKQQEAEAANQLLVTQQAEISKKSEKLAEQQKEIELQKAFLQDIIDNSGESVMAIDQTYKVTFMNRLLKDRYAGSNYDIKEGDIILDKLGEVKDEWKRFYDRALSGEDLNFVLKSSVNKEDNFREYSIHPIVLEGQTVGVSVFSKDVTQAKIVEAELASLRQKK